MDRPLLPAPGNQGHLQLLERHGLSFEPPKWLSDAVYTSICFDKIIHLHAQLLDVRCHEIKVTFNSVSGRINAGGRLIAPAALDLLVTFSLCWGTAD